jgi:hypothetical protein
MWRTPQSRLLVIAPLTGKLIAHSSRKCPVVGGESGGGAAPIVTVTKCAGLWEMV